MPLRGHRGRGAYRGNRGGGPGAGGHETDSQYERAPAERRYNAPKWVKFKFMFKWTLLFVIGI